MNVPLKTGVPAAPVQGVMREFDRAGTIIPVIEYPLVCEGHEKVPDAAVVERAHP
jgi:hypothetical protein